MNQTTELFIQELKSKPLSEYKLTEIQANLQKCVDFYRRFKGENERSVLNGVWNRMAEWYNIKIKEWYPSARPVYKIDYLKNEIK
jgi:hypothetical protein